MNHILKPGLYARDHKGNLVRANPNDMTPFRCPTYDESAIVCIDTMPLYLIPLPGERWKR